MMMIKIRYLIPAIILLFLQTAAFAQDINVKKAFQQAAVQTQLMLLEIKKSNDPTKPELISPDRKSVV